jgi:HlyD family secretion protein
MAAPTAGEGLLVKPSVRWILIAAGVVVVLVLLRETVFRPKGIAVDAARVERGTVEDAVTNSEAGTVKTRERAKLGVEQIGRVLAIPKREGATFRKGDVLLRLDPETARMGLVLAKRQAEAAKSAVAEAAANATLADSSWARVAPLAKQGLASPGDLDAARTKRDAAHAALEAARANSASAEAQVAIAAETLSKTTIVAPFDGVVSQRFVEVGEMLTPGQPALEVLNPRRLYVSAPLDEMDIARVHVGLPARVTLDPYPGRTWNAHVTRVAPFVNDVVQQNRTLEIEVDLELGPDGPLPRPGTSADVEVILDHHDDVLRVPTFAVIENRRVLVIERGRAESRDVTIGLHNWDWTEITSGLREGEWVITSLDKAGVKPGAAVHAKASSTAAAAPRRAAK